MKVDFDKMEWIPGLNGLRFKLHRAGGKQVRLLELTKEFVEPGWCEKGHAGTVLAGDMEIDFRGRIIKYQQGDVLFIPPGAESSHKARALSDRVLLLLVEDSGEA